jgi:hypothetical protein
MHLSLAYDQLVALLGFLRRGFPNENILKLPHFTSHYGNWVIEVDESKSSHQERCRGRSLKCSFLTLLYM